MKTYTLLMLSLLSVLLMTQCRSIPSQQIGKMMNKSISYSLWNSDFFYQSRKLMFNTFSDNVTENDSIIILEYFTEVITNYYCTIYESKNKSTRGYSASTSIKEGNVIIDSLSRMDLRDGILPMVLERRFEEIKKRGEEALITPSTSLIISILRKDEKKKRFNIETFKTYEFNVYD